MKALLGIFLMLLGGFAFGEGASDKPLRIMPVGDSITRGTYLSHSGLPNKLGGGWRKVLQDRLRAEGIAFEFVGELDYNAYGDKGVLDPLFSPRHHGLAGFGNQGILSGGVVPTPKDFLAAKGVAEIRVPGIVEALKRNTPDIVLLMSGANGFDERQRDKLITVICENFKGILLVANITPQKPPRAGYEKVVPYNSSLPGTVERLKSKGFKIYFVDMYSALSVDDISADGVHPSAAGMEKMASVWFAAMQPFFNLFKTPAGTAMNKNSNIYSQCRYLKNACNLPTARFDSGLISYEEGMRDGTWIFRYWSPIGRLDANPVILGDSQGNAAFRIGIGGQLISDGWEVVSESEEPSIRNATVFSVTLSNKKQPLEVVLYTLVDGTGFLSRRMTIKNTGKNSIALTCLDVWRGRIFPCQLGDRYYGDNSKYSTVHGDYEVGYFVDNRHSNEGNFQWRQLGDTPFELTETSGKSGWGHPILYLRDGKAGNIFVVQLAWSGNWRIHVEKKDNCVYAGIGPFGPGNLRVLEAGETIHTPEVHLSGMSGDLSEIAQALHCHLRRSVLPAWDANKCGLVTYNHWGYMQHEISEERLLREIDIALELGAEVFTIDAGWYGNKNEDWHTIGVWKPGDRLSSGLSPVFDYARKKGMKCGLWVWIEGASENSQIIKAHPDWLLKIDGKTQNNHLNLANPEVAKWVESELERIIAGYKIDLLRLDYNAYPGKGETISRQGLEEQSVWRHYEAMYAIWERIRQRHPKLILENCAGGGGRTDLGMLSRFDFTWFSDYTLAPRAVTMQQGMMLALPPERLARALGVTMNAHLGGDIDMQMRMNMLLGNPCITGVWPTLEEKNPVAFAHINHAIELFKRHIRPLFPDCLVFHHAMPLSGSQPEGWCVMEYASPSKSKAVAALFRLAGNASDNFLFRFRGLSRSETYTVVMDNSGETFTASGRELAEDGILIRLSHPMTSELLIATLEEHH